MCGGDLSFHLCVSSRLTLRNIKSEALHNHHELKFSCIRIIAVCAVVVMVKGIFFSVGYEIILYIFLWLLFSLSMLLFLGFFKLFFVQNCIMGCTNSSGQTRKDSHDLKYRKFIRRVDAGQPLAVALNDLYKSFLEACDGVAEGKKKDVSYPSEVRVLKKVSDAKKANLTYQEAKDTASDFLVYAMKCLQEKNWGGHIHTSLHGADGRKSELVLSGTVEFDSLRYSIKQPLHSKLYFFCALE